MQNPKQKFGQGSIVFEKHIIELINFCWNFAHVSYLPMCLKGCLRFVSFCLDLELFARIKGPGF